MQCDQLIQTPVDLMSPLGWTIPLNSEPEVTLLPSVTFLTTRYHSTGEGTKAHTAFAYVSIKYASSEICKLGRNGRRLIVHNC